MTTPNTLGQTHNMVLRRDSRGEWGYDFNAWEAASDEALRNFDTLCVPLSWQQRVARWVSRILRRGK